MIGTTSRAADPPAWVVGLVGLAVASGMALRLLIPNHMDPSIFLAFGREAPVQTRYAQSLLGDVRLRPGLGHDGRFFFAQAVDPWFVDPEMNAAVLDRPLYRAQRMLYPMIAGGFGLFPPSVIVWSMFITNLIAFGVGGWIASRLAAHWGASRWLGLALPLNFGLLFEMNIGSGGVVAYVLGLAGVLAIVEDRDWVGATFLAGAALAREVMILFAAGLVVMEVFRQRIYRWMFVVLPGVAIVAWHVYVRYRLEGITGAGGGRGAFALPFTGALLALRSWMKRPGDLVFNMAMLILMTSFVVRAVQSRLPIAWGALPFVAMAPFLSVNVWREPYDLARALVPVLTSAPFLLLIDEPSTTRGERLGRRTGIAMGCELGVLP